MVKVTATRLKDYRKIWHGEGFLRRHKFHVPRSIQRFPVHKTPKIAKCKVC